MQNVELKNKILGLFYEANRNFLMKNLNNIERDVSERNFCSNLSHEILLLQDKYQFAGYYADCEYNKNGDYVKQIEGNIAITCDLIFHSRGQQQKDNLLALEMKKIPTTKKLLEKDRNRLKALTKQLHGETFELNGFSFPRYVCGYEVGIYYLIDTSKREITLEIYANGEHINTERQSLEYYMRYN